MVSCVRDDQVHETAWLRGLIVQVAEGLERLAAAHEADRIKLQQAAMWLRRQLHRGPPAAEPVAGMGVGQGPATSETAQPGDSDAAGLARERRLRAGRGAGGARRTQEEGSDRGDGRDGGDE